MQHPPATELLKRCMAMVNSNKTIVKRAPMFGKLEHDIAYIQHSLGA